MDFNVESLPYLYHSENCDVAWTREFGGFFIDPNGVRYKYKNPDNWLSYGNSLEFEASEIKIKPTDLFHNLGTCKVKKPWFGVKRKLISQDVINELLNGELINLSDGINICDAPITTNSILFYDSNVGFYKQIILSISGQTTHFNSSIKAQSLIDEFGSYNFSSWRK